MSSKKSSKKVKTSKQMKAKVRAASKSKSKPKPKKNTAPATPATPATPAKKSSSNSRDHGTTLMRRNGAALLQLWVPPGLKNVFVRRALATDKPMTYFMRRALVREANSWGVNNQKFDEKDGKSVQGKGTTEKLRAKAKARAKSSGSGSGGGSGSSSGSGGEKKRPTRRAVPRIKPAVRKVKKVEKTEKTSAEEVVTSGEAAARPSVTDPSNEA